MSDVFSDPAAPSPATTEAPRVSWRLTFVSIVGFWAFYFAINSLRMTVEMGGPQWGLMARRTVVTLTGMLLTLLLCLVLRRLERRSTGVLVAAAFLVSVPVAMLYAVVNFAMFYSIDWAEAGHDPATMHVPIFQKSIYAVCDAALNWYFFVVAWGVLYVALSYAARVSHAERRAAGFRAAAQHAELRALRYQVNPHFLFNTLNSLSSLILRQRGDEAERMIMNLANFFRSSLTADPAEDVPLADEIRMQRLYLDIEQTRFPDRLRVVVELPAALEAVPVPGLILQPLVENAIKHGVARSLRPVTITIRARRMADQLMLTVADDGEPNAAAVAGCGLGLRNVKERLATRFEGAATCSYGARTEGGFVVELTLPLPGPARVAA